MSITILIIIMWFQPQIVLENFKINNFNVIMFTEMINNENSKRYKIWKEGNIVVKRYDYFNIVLVVTSFKN